MGTTAHVMVVGAPDGCLDAVVDRVEELESRWSRFRPTSEVSRWNDGAVGEPFSVTDDTVLLVERAIEGAQVTAGLFDPSLLDEVVAAGYDESIAAELDTGGPLVRRIAVPRDRDDIAAWDRFAVDRASGTVTRRTAARFDPGGIGKGLAADLVVDELVAAG
ncbi:MAG: FAD:protein FMN transferase, partial [Actinomycetes bacterium]